MEKEAIAIDLDDTIADISSIALDIIRMEYVPDASFKKWKHYSIVESFGIDKASASSIWKRAWEKPEKIKLVDKSIPKIIEGLREERKIYIVTATFAKESFFLPWLESKQIGFDRLIHVTHASEKTLLDEMSGIGFYIDDYPLVAESVAAAGKVALLLRKSWNADFSDKDRTERIIKVRSWKEISDFFAEKRSSIDKKK